MPSSASPASRAARSSGLPTRSSTRPRSLSAASPCARSGASWRAGDRVDEATLFRLGGYSALAGVPALLLAGGFPALFFGGFGDRSGPLNDIFSALVLLLSVAPALAVAGLLSEQTGGWFGVLTGLAVLWVLIGAVGQMARALGGLR